MENKSHVVAALMFILVFGIGAAVFFVWLRPEQSSSRTYQTKTSHSVAGLTAQSSVKFKGLKVGHVLSVDFAPEDPNKVQILFTVRNGIPVTKSTYAELATQGIAGLKTLNLSNPDPTAQPLPTNSRHPADIPLHQALLSQLEDSGKQSLQHVNHILNSVQTLLDADNRKHLTQTMAQIDQASRKLVAAETAIEPALKQLPALTRQMQAAIASINRLADEAQSPVAKAGKVEGAVQSASDSATRLARQLNNRTLPRIDRLVTTLNQTANHLDQLAQELAAKPDSVILGPPQPSPGPGEPGFKK